MRRNSTFEPQIVKNHQKDISGIDEKIISMYAEGLSTRQIFKFSMPTRKIIYTTNAIESLNSCYKKLNRQRNVFPSSTALMKSLYLSTLQVTKKWNQPIHGWGSVYNEFCIMYEGRMPE